MGSQRTDRRFAARGSGYPTTLMGFHAQLRQAFHDARYHALRNARYYAGAADPRAGFGSCGRRWRPG